MEAQSQTYFRSLLLSLTGGVNALRKEIKKAEPALPPSMSLSQARQAATPTLHAFSIQLTHTNGSVTYGGVFASAADAKRDGARRGGHEVTVDVTELEPTPEMKPLQVNDTKQDGSRLNQTVRVPDWATAAANSEQRASGRNQVRVAAPPMLGAA